MTESKHIRLLQAKESLLEALQIAYSDADVRWIDSPLGSRVEITLQGRQVAMAVPDSLLLRASTESLVEMVGEKFGKKGA